MKALSYGHTSTGKWTPAGAFERIVAPALQAGGLLPHGRLVAAEGTSQDARAGIDWMIVGRDEAVSTIAARVQWDRDWGTFTIRYRGEAGGASELTKRARSIAAGASYPTYTVQAYVTQPGGLLLNAYVIRTEDLYRHILLPADDGEPNHFRLCGCAHGPDRVVGGALMVTVAISEDGRQTTGSKSTLIGTGVPVRSLWPINEGRGLWQ